MGLILTYMDEGENARADHGIINELSLGAGVVSQGTNQQWWLHGRMTKSQ